MKWYELEVTLLVELRCIEEVIWDDNQVFKYIIQVGDVSTEVICDDIQVFTYKIQVADVSTDVLYIETHVYSCVRKLNVYWDKMIWDRPYVTCWGMVRTKGEIWIFINKQWLEMEMWFVSSRGDTKIN